MGAYSRAPVLPIDVTVIAAPGGETIGAMVLTVRRLDEWRGLAPDVDEERWVYFEPHEADIARWLQSRGVIVRSVREFKKQRPPDAVTSGDRPVPIEFKTLRPRDGRSFNHLTCIFNMKSASSKCPRVVVDARNTDATVPAAEAAVAAAVGEFGCDLDEVIVIVGDAGRGSSAIGWRRG